MSIIVSKDRGDKVIEDEQGYLCALKTGMLWYRQEKTYKLVRADAKEGLVRKIVAPDTKETWVLNAAKGVYEGAGRPHAPVEGIDLRPPQDIRMNAKGFPAPGGCG